MGERRLTHREDQGRGPACDNGTTLPRPIDQIDEALIERLCADKFPEPQVLEFKRELPLTQC